MKTRSTRVDSPWRIIKRRVFLKIPFFTIDHRIESIEFTFEIVESAKIENAVVLENYHPPRMDRWIKKRKKGGKGRKKTFFSRVEKRELIWKPGRAGNNRHPQDRRAFSFSFWTWIQFEFERIRTMFDRASTNFHASDSGRPEFRNDDRLFQCGRIFRPRYKSVFSFYLSFFFFPFSLNFFFPFFNVRSTNGQWGRKFFFNP